MTALLHRLGYRYKKAKLPPGKPDPERQEAFAGNYKNIKEEGGPIYFMDATHPQHNPVIGCGWIKRGEDYPIQSNTGQRRLNINDAIEIQTYSAEIRFDTTSIIALLQQIEAANPHASRIVVRCRPWRAERSRSAPGRRRRGRVAAETKGRKSRSRAGNMQSSSETPPSHLASEPWRGAATRRRARVVPMPWSRSGAYQGTKAVAERKAKGGLGRPVSHPEHGDTPR
jgi:hypothetical protein